MSDCPYGICPIRFVAKKQFVQAKNILETMTEEQKLAFYGLVGLAFDYSKTHGDVIPKSENDILQEYEAYRKLTRKEISENG